MKKKLILLCVFILISSFLNAVDFSHFMIPDCKEDIPGHEKDIKKCKEIFDLYVLVLKNNKEESEDGIRKLAKSLYYVDQVLLRAHNHSDYNFLNKFVLTKTTSFTKYINLLPPSFLDKEAVSERSEWFWRDWLRSYYISVKEKEKR